MARDGYRRRQLYRSLPVWLLRGTSIGFCQKTVWRYNNNASGVEKQTVQDCCSMIAGLFRGL